MQQRICTSLEEYILCNHLGLSALKKVSNIYLDEENLEFISYTYEGKHKILPLELWGQPSEVYLGYVYGYMIGQGYLLIPLEEGWAVRGGNETYYLDANGGSCTCPAFSYRGTCKHRLMLSAYMNIQTRASLVRQEILSSGALF